MTTVKSELDNIERQLSIAKAENERLGKGTKCAAAKLRAALLEIGKSCSESRKLALDAGKSIPVKKREPKEAKEEEDPEEKLPEATPLLERQNAEPEVSEVTKRPRGRRPKVAAA